MSRNGGEANKAGSANQIRRGAEIKINDSRQVNTGYMGKQKMQAQNTEKHKMAPEWYTESQGKTLTSLALHSPRLEPAISA